MSCYGNQSYIVIDGFMDEAQVYRDQYGADFMLLVQKCGEYAGMAWVAEPKGADYYSYAVYASGYVYGRVWSHEMGHLQGCQHDRISENAGTRAYAAYGNCWEDTSKTDCTCYSSIMTYQCSTVPNGCTSCTGRDYYANVNVYNAGSPTGIYTIFSNIN